MAEENPFDQIQKFLKEFNGEINIIDEKIDIELQMEYFDLSKKMKDSALTDWHANVELLSNDQISLGDKKRCLVQLASVEDVKVFRFLEEFAKSANDELKHWTLLALQESRLLLQSKLLDQSQVLISTGLGGKDNRLRYFFVLFNKTNRAFTKLQQKVIKGEFEFVFGKNNSIIEEISFSKNTASILALVPLSVPIQDVFNSAVDECNQMGDFLKENSIITNVRMLTKDEIDIYNKGNS
jgi:hypothetical protein